MSLRIEQRLDIVCELRMDKRIYFLDSDMNVYRVASHVTLPHSPLVSFTEFNKRDMFIKIENDYICGKVIDFYKKLMGENNEQTR